MDIADLPTRTDQTSGHPAAGAPPPLATLRAMIDAVHLPWERMPGHLPQAMWAGARRSRELTPVMVQRYRGRHQSQTTGWHDGWEMVVVFNGRGLLLADQAAPLGSAAAYLLPPRMAHRERSDGIMEVLWIGLAGTLLDDLPRRLLRLDQGRGLVALARRLWLCAERRPAAVGVEMDGLVRCLLGRAGAARVEGPAPSPLSLDESIEYLHRHYARDLSIAGLARRFGSSERHFNRVFRRHTGVAPLRYLRRIRIENARKLMTYARHTVAEVAALVGYDDPAYFARVFRQETGLTPSAIIWGLPHQAAPPRTRLRRCPLGRGGLDGSVAQTDG